MDAAPRKKSPRAPSLSLDAAIERALRIYKQENRHPAPPELVAQHLGYKGANNGAFVATMATLGYYGLVERSKDGRLAVSKNVESYNFAPDEGMRRSFLIEWLKTPPVFAGLLDKYGDRLPSDGNIKFDLIHLGFAPATADGCLNVFRRSVEFVDYYRTSHAASSPVGEQSQPEPEAPENVETKDALPNEEIADRSRGSAGTHAVAPNSNYESGGGDRIPVRLSGGRRAWIEVPSPFYQADKKRLVNQIELLLADDEPDGESNN